MLHFTLASIFDGLQDEFLRSLIDTDVLHFEPVLADDSVGPLQETLLVLAHNLVNFDPKTRRITENCIHGLPQFLLSIGVSVGYHPVPDDIMLFSFELPRNL